MRIEETKTGVGRKIPVQEPLLEALRFHEKRHYFSGRKWKPLLKDAGLPTTFSFHDLRHTHATLLLLEGVNLKIAQERLGHANIQMTLDTYSHLLTDTQEVAVKAIERLFA